MFARELFNKIENANPVDIGDVLSKSFKLYQTYFSQGIVHVLVMLAIVIPLGICMYLPILPIYIEMFENIGTTDYSPELMDDLSPSFAIIWLIIVFLVSLLLQMVILSIFGHFLKFLKKEDFNSQEDIGGYFTILKQHSGKVIVLVLVSMIIQFLGALLCYVPLIYLMIPLHWIYPMFVFNENLSVSDIITASFKFANKFWGYFFVIGLVSYLFSFGGLILCYVGGIITGFFYFISTYVAYRDTIGFDDYNDEIDTIGDVNF